MKQSTKPGRVRGGLLVPSVSILHSSGSVNTGATLDHTVRLSQKGAEGVVILGKTGLGDQLGFADKIELIKAVGQARVSGQLPPGFQLLTGTGTSDYDEAVNIVWTAQDAQFDGLLVLPPEQGDQLEFFKKLAIACDIGTSNPLTGNPGYKIDLFAYHYPDEPLCRPVDRRTVMFLAGFPCFMGLKSSARDANDLDTWESINALSHHTPKVFMGNDFFIAEGLRRNAIGAIAGSGNTEQGLVLLVQLFEAFRSGNQAKAYDHQLELATYVKTLLEGPGFLPNVLTNLV